MSGLNEFGSFQGNSLEKIQAKANKIKSGSSSSALPQAANSFRAKLLRNIDG